MLHNEIIWYVTLWDCTIPLSFIQVVVCIFSLFLYCLEVSNSMDIPQLNYPLLKDIRAIFNIWNYRQNCYEQDFLILFMWHSCV